MDNYRVLAFGGAGGSIANSLLTNGFDQDKLFYFDNDEKDVNNNLLKNKFLIGVNAIHEKGITDILKAKKSFVEDKDLFEKLITPNIIYIVAGAFGGGFFTGISGLIAELLFQHNKKFLFVATSPFSFEGANRSTPSLNAIKELNHYTDKLILLKNEDAIKHFGENLALSELFRKIDYMIVEVIKEITFEIHVKSEIKNRDKILLTPSLEDLLLQIKDFINNTEYLIATNSSKFIIADTNKELLKALTIDQSYINKISARKFEELIEYVYKLSGYETELTPATRDGGVDVLVWTPPPVLGDKFLTIIQAKKYKGTNKVGASEIRELLGTSIIFKADKAQMITTSDYSKEAIKTAKNQKIDLIKFYELNETIQRILTE